MSLQTVSLFSYSYGNVIEMCIRVFKRVYTILRWPTQCTLSWHLTGRVSVGQIGEHDNGR